MNFLETLGLARPSNMKQSSNMWH